MFAREIREKARKLEQIFKLAYRTLQKLAREQERKSVSALAHARASVTVNKKREKQR